ncbi:MAG: MFS transporter [Burkholderiales bacterium]|nr:MFS transporter [Burkholderiales bacterium]
MQKMPVEVRMTTSTSDYRSRTRLDLLILAMGQGLSGSVISLLTAVSSLVGAMLAPDRLATLPVTATVIGAAVMVYSVSTLMLRLGRRRAFILGSAIGAIGSCVAAAAVYLGNFPLFVGGAFILGLFTAFNQYYRFAAADVSPSKEFRVRAISYVTAGGILGGFIGPFVANSSADIVLIPFLGTFFALFAICGLLAAVQSVLSLDEPGQAASESVGARRSMWEISTSPGFLVATINCAIGFGVMTLLMNATPLAMKICGFSLGLSASVLQWHFVAMYAPALISGPLMAKLGIRPVILIGAVVNLIGIATAVYGVSYMHFWFALVCFGIGWCFMFNGGTALLTTTYTEAEKQRAQGLNSFVVYVTNAVASLGSGFVLAVAGWTTVNLVAVPVLLASIALTLWSARPLVRKAE